MGIPTDSCEWCGVCRPLHLIAPIDWTTTWGPLSVTSTKRLCLDCLGGRSVSFHNNYLDSDLYRQRKRQVLDARDREDAERRQLEREIREEVEAELRPPPKAYLVDDGPPPKAYLVDDVVPLTPAPGFEPPPGYRCYAGDSH